MMRNRDKKRERCRELDALKAHAQSVHLLAVFGRENDVCLQKLSVSGAPRFIST